MVPDLTARLALLLARDDSWNEALACLVHGARAEVAIALETGRPPRRLGAFGPLPAAAANAGDEETLLDALRRMGMGAIWSRTFRREPASSVVVAVAARHGDGFRLEQLEHLDAAAPLLELKAAAGGIDAALEKERATRRTLEARLAEIERQSTIGTVAAAVAHDLSAPISALLMEVSELRERVTYLAACVPETNHVVRNVVEDIRGLVDHCTDSTERARQLLTDFRLAAHPGGASSVPSTAINVGDTLRSCVRLITPLARGKARLELSIEPDLPIIPGTRKRLYQALTNLLTNAVHAASVREGFAGLVEARARRAGTEILIEIQDNGVGIPAEVLAHIFEPFFTTKGPEQGTGLGLPIARDVVESHGGRLDVESERGRGALFRIRLPVTAVPAHAAPTNVRRRVLVVDDDDGVARALERILRADYDVTIARGGEQALELIPTVGPFDAMLVDLSMPGIDGPQLFERIRHRWPGLERKIIFSTGGAYTAASRAFLASVPNSRFEKPISREELRPLLQVVVNAA
jgi:two-component system, cell cycle sensor histidine kinase and response regulator CckA